MTLDPRLYLVTGDITSGDRAEAVVAAAVAGGVTLVQLRAKAATTPERAGIARRLARVLAPAGVPLLVNDDIEAARLANVQGVHVGPDDLHPAAARAMLGPHALIGWSIHSPDQLSDTAALAACDYLAASPVWPTPTKTDTTSPLGLEGVRALRMAMPSRLPLVGIGGIAAGNVGAVIRAGADGVAVVSAIWNAADPASEARRLRAAVDGVVNDRDASQ